MLDGEIRLLGSHAFHAFQNVLVVVVSHGQHGKEGFIPGKDPGAGGGNLFAIVFQCACQGQLFRFERRLSQVTEIAQQIGLKTVVQSCYERSAGFGCQIRQNFRWIGRIPGLFRKKPLNAKLFGKGGIASFKMAYEAVPF